MDERTDNPRVTVVMPVWNADPAQLREAVTSLVAQTLDDFELIVVEDPSDRLAGPVLESVGDPRIRHVLGASRTSMATARNRGLACARAELVAMFDCDDVCEPQRLQKQVAFLEAHPEVAVVGCSLQIIGGDGKSQGWRDYPAAHAAILQAMPSYNPIGHPGVMLRKSVVESAGGYSETGEVCEDYELWCRLANSGARFANLPEPLVRYRIHDDATKLRRLRETLKATLEIKRKYFGDRLSMRARARMWGERCLFLLPPRLVLALFVRTAVRR